VDPPADGLRPQELVLDILGAHLRPRDREVWSGGLVALLESFGFSTGSARIALARMARRGLLDRSRRGRLISYTPTARLIALLDEGDRRIFGFGTERPWDGAWTLLWYAIPEGLRVARRRLSRRLRFLGFGSLQDGAWVAPRDREDEVLALVGDLELDEHVTVFVGRPARSVDIRALVERAWNLDEVAARYDAFIADFGPFRDAAARDALSDDAAFAVRIRAVDAYRRFAALDPELPDAVDGRVARRAEAIEVFHAVYEDLAPAAQRHFDATCEVPGGAGRATASGTARGR
jgi:phenylacetic acid degradation operon negative regulatory protein